MAGRQDRAGQDRAGLCLLPLWLSWSAAAHDTLYCAEAEIRGRIDLLAASKRTEASPVLAMDQSSVEMSVWLPSPHLGLYGQKSPVPIMPQTFLQPISRWTTPTFQPGAQEPGFQLPSACLLGHVFLVSECLEK